MSTLEKYCFYSFLALIIWLPIPLGSNRDWAWAIIGVWAALQTLTLVLSYRGRIPLSILFKYRRLLFSFTFFQIWVFIQTIPMPWQILEFLSLSSYSIYQLVEASQGYISLDSKMTTIALYKGMIYTLLVFNAILLVTSSQRLKQVVLVIVISGTLQAFYAAIIVLLNLAESPVFALKESGIATGSFVYKNHLANYLMMCLCMGLGLIVTQLHTRPSTSNQELMKRMLENSLSSKMLIRLCLVIMVIALVMTRSRMGNSAFFVATAIGGLIALLFYKNKPRSLIAFITSIMVIDTLIVGAIFGLEKVKQRLAETSLLTESRDQVVIWSLDIIRDFPLTGTGMGSFYTVFPMYSKEDIGFYDHAHNDYMQFMVEAGVPATLLLGFIVVTALYSAFSTIRTRNSRTMKGTALGCIMAIIGTLIHISVDFNLQPMANAATFSMILFLANASLILPAVGQLTSQEGKAMTSNHEEDSRNV